MIHIFNRFSVVAAMLFGMTALVSCDDFLTEIPETGILEEEAMTSLQDAEQVCLGIYSTFKNPNLYSGAMIEASEVQADLFYAATGSTNTFGNFYRWQLTSGETTLANVYGGLYQIVNRCNFFFDHKEEVEKTLKNDAERDLMKKYVADAAFMRAYAYHDLVRLFCKAYTKSVANEPNSGVPLYIHYREEKNENTILPRATLQECYDFILEDLKVAAENEPRSGCDTPFITQGAIAALRARIALYMQNWDEAEKYASEVIDKKVGSLPLYELADANYDCVSPGGTASNEYEVMLQYDTADEIIWKLFFSTTDHTGCLGQFYMGMNSGRYNPSYLPANWLLMSYPDYDLRYAIHFPTVTTVQGVKWELFTKFPGNPEIDGGVAYYYCNMPKMLRLAEIYLIRAEARCMMDKTQKACEDITALRKARIRNYGSFACDPEKLLKEIQNERARELVGEGFRLTDLKRWGVGITRTKQTGTIDGSNCNELKVNGDNPEFVWPIPLHEVTASNGVVVQNQY